MEGESTDPHTLNHLTLPFQNPATTKSLKDPEKDAVQKAGPRLQRKWVLRIGAIVLVVCIALSIGTTIALHAPLSSANAFCSSRIRSET
jgi:hypothetical protein